jgi:glycosyltransferase involved in cell wall biosynthesis
MNKLGIIVLAFNEVKSLEETIKEIGALELRFKPDIVISTSIKASVLCQETAIRIASEKENVRVHFQSEPFVAAAILEACDILDTEFIVYMSADGETPPSAIPSMLSKIQTGSFDVVSTSRWIEGGGFERYGFLKYCVSFLAQKLCKVLYNSRLTEFTYGFRVYKKNVLTEFNFKEQKHPFFLESLLVPIRLGLEIAEVPAKYSHRLEGKSVVDVITILGYVRPMFRLRISRKSELKKKLHDL